MVSPWRRGVPPVPPFPPCDPLFMEMGDDDTNPTHAPPRVGNGDDSRAAGAGAGRPVAGERRGGDGGARHAERSHHRLPARHRIVVGWPADSRPKGEYDWQIAMGEEDLPRVVQLRLVPQRA